MLSTGILARGPSREAQSQAPPSLPLPSGLRRSFSDGRDLSLNGTVLLLASWLSLLTLRKPFSIKPKICLSLSLPQATSCLHLGPMLGSPEAWVSWLSFCLLVLFLRDCCILFLLLYFTFACNSSLIFYNGRELRWWSCASQPPGPVSLEAWGQQQAPRWSSCGRARRGEAGPFGS